MGGMNGDAKAFWNVVRKIVREELQRQLPGMVQRTLGEMYVRQLAEQQDPPPRRPQRVNETRAQAPRRRENDPLDQPASPLLDPRVNPMASLYSSVRPLDEDDAPPPRPGVLDLDRIREITERMNESSGPGLYDAAPFPDRPLDFDGE